MNRIRAFFLKHILPEVHKYFFDALDCIRDDLYSMGLLYTFVDLFTSTSMGDLFVPRNHDDDDTWLSVLVAVGECSLGGGFAHPAQGVVHAVNPGDIFVVNPTQVASPYLGLTSATSRPHLGSATSWPHLGVALLAGALHLDLRRPPGHAQDDCRLPV